MSSTATEAKKAVEPASEVDDLAALVISINRIIDRLQSAAKETGPDLALSDWLLLHKLKSEGAMGISRAASRIGVTRQRVHQQTEALEKAGFISTAPGEGKTRSLSITTSGETIKKAMEQEFLKSLSGDAGVVPAKQIHATRMSTTRLVRAMAVKPPAKDS